MWLCLIYGGISDLIWVLILSRSGELSEMELKGLNPSTTPAEFSLFCLVSRKSFLLLHLLKLALEAFSPA